MRLPRNVIVVAVLSLCAAGCGGGGGEKSNPAPSSSARGLILVTIDTLRADHLGCYGARGAATPAIDALAASGVLFDSAVSVAPLTLPAHASLMTGRYPVALDVHDNVSYVVPEAETTLAEVLRAKGYSTAAFIGAFPVAARFGLSQGFETYDEAFTSSGNAGVLAAGEGVERHAFEVNRAAMPWLERAAESGRPFFLWVHYFDPHYPYDPPPDVAQRFPQEPYAGEIAVVDEAVAALLATLDRTGATGRMAVLVTADHGEALGDHGEATHGYFVYEATLRVPMIARVPWMGTGGGAAKRASRVVTQLVSQVDVMPTVLDLLGVAAPEKIQGRSLVPLLSGEHLADAPALSECAAAWLEFRFSPLRAVREGVWKYVDSPRPELYDLSTDPGETKNLAGKNAKEAERLRGLLGARFGAARAGAIATRSNPASSSSNLSGEERAKLASLGYLAGGGGGALARSIPEPSVRMKDPKDGLAGAMRYDHAALDSAAGEFVKAADTLRSLAKEIPESPSVKYQLGQALLMAANKEAGQEAIPLGTQAGPATPESQAMLREARDVLSPVVASDPANAAARVRLGQALELLDEKKAAIEQYRAAVTLTSALPEARVLLARLLFRSGGPDEGVEEMRRAVAASPENISYRRELATMLERTGREKDIEGVMLDFTRARPDDARAWNELGSFRIHRHDFEGAEKAFRQAARLDPSNPTALTNLGGLLFLKKKYDEAEKQYRAAITADAEQEAAELGLVRTLLHSGREEEGRRLLDEYARVHPDDSRVHSYWGIYLADVKKDPAGARQEFRRALQLNPRDSIALQELASGR